MGMLKNEPKTVYVYQYFDVYTREVIMHIIETEVPQNKEGWKLIYTRRRAFVGNMQQNLNQYRDITEEHSLIFGDILLGEFDSDITKWCHFDSDINNIMPFICGEEEFDIDSID